MATYTSKGDYIPLGAEFKMNVSMDAIGGYHMGDVAFSCSFVSKNKVTLTKSQMVEIDEDNYVAPLSSTALGEGILSVIYEADIPDEDFSDGLRHEVAVIKTKLKIK